MNRLLLALLLLAGAWPTAALAVKAAAHQAGLDALVWMAAHTPVTATAGAALILLRTPTAARLLAPLVGDRAARFLAGGAR